MTQLLSEKEAARILGLSRQTLANWRCTRKGPAYHKLSNRVLYSLEDLEAFRVSRRVNPEGAAE
jgi:DNA-binding transcriptional regulator YiaG